MVTLSAGKRRICKGPTSRTGPKPTFRDQRAGDLLRLKGFDRSNRLIGLYNGLHGKAHDQASGLQARSLGAIALLVCTVPSVLSIAFHCRNERDALIPPDGASAHVRGRPLAGDLPRHYHLRGGPPVVVGSSNLGPESSLGQHIRIRGNRRAKSSSFLPASPSTLFLIPVA